MKRKLKQIAQQLMADKKKLSFMIALLLVGLLLWGRLLLQGVPRSAHAEDLASREQSQADAETALEPFESSLRQAVYVDLPSDVTRDLFAINRRFYQSTKTDTVEPLSEEKINNQTPDVDPRVVVDRAGKELTLEATMVGDNPRAIINGRVLQPGQKINGFELKQVEQRHVILEMNGIKVELKM